MGCNTNQGEEREAKYTQCRGSANINTNPRTEQGVITINRELYQFYKDYFDGIK